MKMYKVVTSIICLAAQPDAVEQLFFFNPSIVASDTSGNAAQLDASMLFILVWSTVSYQYMTKRHMSAYFDLLN